MEEIQTQEAEIKSYCRKCRGETAMLEPTMKLKVMNKNTYLMGKCKNCKRINKLKLAKKFLKEIEDDKKAKEKQEVIQNGIESSNHS